MSLRPFPAPLAVPAALLVLLLCAGSLSAQEERPVAVVAAENFYGDIARQIGGDKVTVMSIIADPAVDPHEYEATVRDAEAAADADIVIENGGGYDAWMDKLLSASPRPPRIVLRAFTLAVHRLPDNEHVWYNVENVQALAIHISRSLQRLRPKDAALFARNDRGFQQSIEQILRRMQRITRRFYGAPVALTESIFAYEAGLLGLRVLTPFELQKAIAEGNDPPADALVEAEDQIRQKKVRVLIFNTQTSSALTSKLRDDAAGAGIPSVGVTETMPAGETYQTWMLRQLDALEKALSEAGS